MKWKVILLSASLLVILSLTASCQPADSEQIAELEEENQQLREHIKVLESQIAEIQENIEEQPNPWSQEGLYYHPQADRMKVEGQEYGYTPGTTEWKDTESEVYSDFTRDEFEGSEDPADLLMDVKNSLWAAELLGEDLWQITSRLLISEDEAQGIVMFWGLKDDSVAGTDYRVNMVREDGQWFATEVQERQHCRRGVDQDEQICQ